MYLFVVGERERKRGACGIKKKDKKQDTKKKSKNEGRFIPYK